MEKPVRPEIRGVFAVGGMLLGIFSVLAFINYSGLQMVSLHLFAAAGALLLLATGSLAGDLLFTSPKTKLIALLLTGLPAAFVKAGPATGAFLPTAITLLLAPLAVAGSCYLTNNLQEKGNLGMGMVAFLSLAMVSILAGKETLFLILLSGTGALAAASWHGANRKPSTGPIGDLGAYSIGALIATVSISGNLELAGSLLLLPYLLDLALKAGGSSLEKLTSEFIPGPGRGVGKLSLVGVEAVFGLIAILVHL